MTWHMRHPKLLLAAAAAVLLLWFQPPPLPAAQSPTGVAAQAATIKLAADELGRVLDRAIAQADFATANRLRQVKAELLEIIDRLEQFQKETFRSLNDLADEPVRELHSLGLRLKQITDNASNTVANTVDTGLVGLMVAVDAVPFTTVRPYLAAVRPARLMPDATNRRVVFYGYFGKPVEKFPVEAWVVGQRAVLSKTAGGYALDLPASLILPEQGFVDVVVKYPVTYGWIWKATRYEQASERIYIERLTPFLCSVKLFVPNPDFRATLTGAELKYWAATQGGRNRPSDNGTIPARDLFVQSIDPAEHSKYDLTTIALTNATHREEHNDPCEHAQSSHSFGWNPASINYSIQAPSAGTHQHSGTRQECVLGLCVPVPYYFIHGGGGSWRDVFVTPTFAVNRLGVDPTVLSRSISDLALRKNTTHELDLPVPAGWSVHVGCEFLDGDEQFSAGPLVLSSQDTEEVSNNLTARYDAGRLYISTVY